jgi:cation diffusion facilitator family transporter
VAVVGLLVNLLSAWMLRDPHQHSHGHAHAHGAHAHAHAAPAAGKDLNRHAAFVHVLADALTSVAAIVALLGGLLFGWSWLDPLMGVIGALIIAVWAKGLLLETAKVLLDREMDSPVVERVRTALAQEADTELADLHLWRVGRGQFACIVSVVTHGSATADRYKARLAGIDELVHVTVEVNCCSTGAAAREG